MDGTRLTEKIGDKRILRNSVESVPGWPTDEKAEPDEHSGAEASLQEGRPSTCWYPVPARSPI